jgi:SOS response associated peptidase (SRAP)
MIVNLHDRMPVILEPPDWPTLLGEVDDNPAALLKPSACDVLKVWPVSKQVNSPKNNRASGCKRLAGENQPSQPAFPQSIEHVFEVFGTKPGCAFLRVPLE